MRGATRLLVVVLLAVGLLVPTPAGAAGVTAVSGSQRSLDTYRFFAPTGHSVGGPFLAFFEANGGIDVFGYPLTEAFEEDGRQVQYFQRHRMEYWPENDINWRVQLTLLGDLVLGPAAPPVPPPSDPNFLFFPQTGHSIGPPFRDFFAGYGGTLIFGYPTSETYPDGPHLVQRFQRARLEYRPENPPAYQVQPGLLGVQYLQAHGPAATELMRAVPPAQTDAVWYVWGSWATSTEGFLSFKLHNNQVAAAAVDGTVLKPGETYNFNRVLYDPNYVAGLGYGPDNQYVWMRAGGVCAAATGLYRAAYNAGLEIRQVYPHTLTSYVPFGWDATVEEGGADLVFRNDTGTDLRLRASLDGESQQLLFWIEGRQPADRTVLRDGPRQTGERSYEVARTIIWADGRQRSEHRKTTYVGDPPPLPPELQQSG